MNKIIQKHMKEVALAVAEKREKEIKEAIDKTDWDKYSVIHIVYYRPALFSDRIYGETRVFRYEDRVPKEMSRDFSTYSHGSRRMEVQTVTKPLLEQLDSEYDIDIGIGE